MINEYLMIGEMISESHLALNCCVSDLAHDSRVVSGRWKACRGVPICWAMHIVIAGPYCDMLGTAFAT
jgi:hypothetical protein